MGNEGAGITLSTPTSVCMPLTSQRTSSQMTALCRSGRMTLDSILTSHHSTHQQGQQTETEHNPVDRKWHKSPVANPIHEPCDDRKRDEKGNNKSNCDHDPLVRSDRERRNLRFVMVWHHALQKIVSHSDHHCWHRKKKRKFKCGRTRHAGDLSRSNRGH